MKNKILYGILILIIILLSTLCYLLYNDTSKEVKEKSITTNYEKSDLAKNYAEAIVANIFTNDTVRDVLDNSLPYAKIYTYNNESYSESDLGLESTAGYTYIESNFSSFEETMNYIKQYFTTDYFNDFLLNKTMVATESNTYNGITEYNYYEYEGKLYITGGNKGGDAEKSSLKEVKYNILDYSDKEIKVSINASWLDAYGESGAKEEIEMTLSLEDNLWKISSYTVK